jgi:hypothetical protein
MARQRGARSFTINRPQQGSTYATDPDGKIQVVVQDSGGNQSYYACISDFGAAPAGGDPCAGSSLGWTQLGPQSGGIFSNPVPAGSVPVSPPASNNKSVYVQACNGSVAGDSDSHDFKAYRGSGSGVQLATATQTGGGIRQAKQPVPAAVQLRPVPAGDTGNGAVDPPTTLHFCNIPDGGGCWLSEPIDLGRGSDEPAYWQLCKSDSRTWALHLRRGAAHLLTYLRTTTDEHDYLLPIEVHAAHEAYDPAYPPTILVSAAP